MVSHNQNQINRLKRELVDLEKKSAHLCKQESDLLGNLNRAQDALSRTKNSSTVKAKLREIERYTKSRGDNKKKQSDISNKMYQKARSLREYQNRQNREEEKARKKAEDEQRKLMREREAHERRLSSMTPTPYTSTPYKPTHHTPPRESTGDKSVEEYDFFVCHASEDKEDFVDELVRVLNDRGAKVWYDKIVLKVGDSLRRGIDKGLMESKFGIVILSENFFGSDGKWREKELNALIALENSEQDRHGRVLPIWYDVSEDQVAGYSPILVDRRALLTSSMTIEEIADKLMDHLQNT